MYNHLCSYFYFMQQQPVSINRIQVTYSTKHKFKHIVIFMINLPKLKSQTKRCINNFTLITRASLSYMCTCALHICENYQKQIKVMQCTYIILKYLLPATRTPHYLFKKDVKDACYVMAFYYNNTYQLSRTRYSASTGEREVQDLRPTHDFVVSDIF